VGLNYLKYCITNDPQSLDILRGLKQVIDRQAGFFSTLYPCHTPQSKRWFMMAAFAPNDQNTGTPLIHIDVSHLYDAKHWSGLDGQSFAPTSSAKFFEELRRTVTEAIAGGKLNSLQNKVQQEISPSDQRRLSRLTPRQREILGHLALGESNAEIAVALDSTPSTVKAQVAATLRKLEFSNRTQAALYADRLGLSGM
jgi:DNA-binding CsgD family transcriptional regulator